MKITLHPDKGVQNVNSVKTKPVLPNDSESPQTQSQMLHFSPFFQIRTHNTIASEPLQRLSLSQ